MNIRRSFTVVASHRVLDLVLQKFQPHSSADSDVTEVTPECDATERVSMNLPPGGMEGGI